jgi:hypothetical protein
MALGNGASSSSSSPSQPLRSSLKNNPVFSSHFAPTSMMNNSSTSLTLAASGAVASSSFEAHRLQKELNTSVVKHNEELYWLKLELDTTRREKEAVEDRMAELYRDMQEIQDGGGPTAAAAAEKAHTTPLLSSSLRNGKNEQNGNSSLPEQDSVLVAQKHERVIKILHHQIGLLKQSSNQVVQSLKDEIKDLVDDKSRSEMELMNQLTDLEQEKDDLLVRCEALDDGGGRSNNTATSGAATTGNGAANQAAVVRTLRLEIQALKDEKAALNQELFGERSKSRATIAQLRMAKTTLSQQVEKLQGDLLVLRSSAETVQSLEQMREDRDESLQMLERVALLWDKADEAIQSLETLMQELKPSSATQSRRSGEEEGGASPSRVPVDGEEEEEDGDRERALSTLESASLVHGQVKVSLMLIELKLRNNLACLKNDAAQLGSIVPADPVVSEHIAHARDEAMESIAQIEAVLNHQIDQLEDKSVAETKEVKETLEEKISEMRGMQARQVKLEQEIAKMSIEELGELARAGNTTNNASENNPAVELYISKKILERLQNEVLQVVERVREKNEIIGRMEATIDEHRVREKTLIEELRRLMKERSEHLIAEQERIAARARKLSRENNDDGDETEVVEDEEEYEDEDILYEEEIEETTHGTVFEDIDVEDEVVEYEEEVVMDHISVSSA